MKKLYKIVMLLSGVALGSGLQSCVSEDPFGSNEEGTLNIRAEIKSDVVITRAESLNDIQSLRDKCVVYIESNKGVVRKFIGLDNLPVDPIPLKEGHYIAEAWTGDSVSASFSSKFYRGKKEFEIEGGVNKIVDLSCNIANVIVSVNQDALELEMTDLEVTFSHSRGSLIFNEENIPTDKGYFMMPNADSDLSYTVKGKKSDGTPIEHTGVISNVQRAHEYIMNIMTEDSENQLGGGLIRIYIEDIPVIEETIDIYGIPTIMGDGFDIDAQVVGDRTAQAGTDKAFVDRTVYLRAYEGFYSVELSGIQNFENDALLKDGLVLTQPDSYSLSDLENRGISLGTRNEKFDAVTGQRMEEWRITFKKKFFDNLAPMDTEYQIQINVNDNQNSETGNKSNTKVLRIANSENAIEHLAPVETADAPDAASQPMAILAHSATIEGIVRDESVTDYGIKYRKQGDSDWITVPANNTRAAANIRYSVTVRNLQPGTTYEYKAYEANFDDCAIRTFTTEAIYSIPNASFENWSTYTASTLLGTKTVILPWGEGNKSVAYWGSGNEGAATANMTLTDKSTDMVHSGTYSARLESNQAMGMLAAGNIFVGEYVRTEGTNGVLSIGRSYNGSHPAKLKVYANYRPKTGATIKYEPAGGLPEGFAGGKDHGQIYVALSTEPIEIRTEQKNLKVFDPDDPVVVGYGQITWTDDFGPEGELQEVVIPITYNSRAATKPATHLVIVVSASKYGDYFSGSKGSVMYLDDFELVYE